VTTIAALAELDRDIADLDPARRDTFVRQAASRCRPATRPTRSRRSSCCRRARRRPTPLVDVPMPSTPIGFAALPAPDDGDVFLDFEGHPFWRADVELFFLFGLIERDARRASGSSGRSGRTTRTRRRATKALVDHLAARRRAVPRHARVPLQPHRADVARAAHAPSTASPSWSSNS
jgi:predicted RecB family nuclease